LVQVKRTPASVESQSRFIGRVLAVIAGVAALAGAMVWGAIGLLGISWAFERPDDTVARATPDFGPPHDWGDVANAVALSPLFAFVFGVLVALAVGLLRWGITSPAPSWRKLAAIPLAAIPLVLLAAGVSQGLQQL
jgi:hypothetical protein